MIKSQSPKTLSEQILLAILLGVMLFQDASLADITIGRQGVIATVHPIASEAGRNAFLQGGNAVDAAIAAALTLGVVDGHNSGLGGGCLILIRRPDGTLLAIDGRETAPATATRDMYIRDGTAVSALSRDGALAVGVPGALAAYQRAMKSAGKLTIDRHLLAAADIAEQGFTVDSSFARNLSENHSLIALFPEASRMLFKPDESPYIEGEILRLPDLAKSYRSIAENENWFYQGEYAEQVGVWMHNHGGFITPEDFRRYQSIQREPIVSTYRGYEIIGFPPPTSGGIIVAEILNILENFDLADLLRRHPAEAYHIIVEAMKLSFADRAQWLGDSDFAAVPRGLIHKEYATELAKRINPTTVSQVDNGSMPPGWQTEIYPKHTTHIATADGEGNWVSITATINTSFGSKVVIPGTGIFLNNTLDDFSAQPGVPNAFGLVGGDANAVEPMKRPLSSMSPTLVLKDGVPVFSVGAAGGPKIITQVVMAIVHRIDGNRTLADSVKHPRLHHQWLPNKLFMEKSFDPVIRDELSELGHDIEELERAAVVQAIERASDGDLIGIADPRVPGKAIGL